MLKIGQSFVFEDDWSQRRSSLMYFEGDEDEKASWSVDIGFAIGEWRRVVIGRIHFTFMNMNH